MDVRKLLDKNGVVYLWNKIKSLPISTFNNDSGYLTEHQSLSEYAKKTELPTKTSDLTNDSGFLTEHQDISGKQDVLSLETDVKMFIDKNYILSILDDGDGVYY